MKEQEKRKSRRVDAKRTALGRFLCRLLGDEMGQGLMEYVVLGVLVIAGVVAAAIFFSDTVRDNFLIMVYTIQGDLAKADELKQKRAGKTPGGVEGATGHSNIQTGGQMDGDGGGEGGEGGGNGG